MAKNKKKSQIESSDLENKETLGSLVLVGTPIGNLDDFSARGIETLKTADYIYCEDTRRSRHLLNKYGIVPKNALQSFHDHSPPKFLNQIHQYLNQGAMIAYITDSGMPVVSDPGFVLVRLAKKAGIKVTSVPGPSAANMLFALSGIGSPKYFFHGFFPRTRGEIEKAIDHVRLLEVAHLFYEAPSRIRATIEIFLKNLPGAKIVIGRELTKSFEEVIEGTAEEILAEMDSRDADRLRGEYVFAVFQETIKRNSLQKREKTSSQETLEVLDASEKSSEDVLLNSEQQAEIASFIKAGKSSKDTARELSKKYRVSRKIIYDFIIRHLT